MNNARAGKGSIAGASGDAGVEFRRAVAAYAVAHGLSGTSLAGLDIPPADARVAAVSLETEDAVDDLRVEFTSGWVAQIQAKRTLGKGKVLEKAVQQWVQAVAAELDPEKDRLVIVAGTVSGPLKLLRGVLDRGRLTNAGPTTKAEQQILEHVEDLLGPLDEAKRRAVLKCAAIWELPVEEADEPGARVAIGLLQGLVQSRSAEDGRRAWKQLVDLCGHTARLRGGRDLASWQRALLGEGTVFGLDGETPAAELEATRQAVERYRARIVRMGETIDLRGLGASLPPLSAAEADAGIEVGTGAGGEPDNHDLLWALLSRSRVVLTGLPGGGKSTAIRNLAARLCRFPGAPLPVLVSLRDVHARDRTVGFRDRLVEAAVRDDRREDRGRLAKEIERLLNCGGVVLLLDALDEVHRHRAEVISEIEALLSATSEDVDVLLATRDVAYGHAQTLGWPTLRVLPPRNVRRTVRAVLRQSPKSADVDWLEERTTWVDRALAQGKDLERTPLVPVLLALLATERSVEVLPVRRPEILKAAVESVVARHELRRSDGRPIGPLTDSSLASAAMLAFAVEANAILTGGGQIPFDLAVERVAGELMEGWALPPASGRTAATDAVHFFDECGIFVLAGAEQVVTPHIASLAEIGDVLWINAHPDQIPDWVEQRLVGRQLEPLVLGAGMTPAITAALGHALPAHLADQAVTQAAARAATEGAAFSDATIRALSEALIRRVGAGNKDGWTGWATLMSLPLPADLRQAAEAAARTHGDAHALVARASLALRFDSKDEILERVDDLLKLLAMRDLRSYAPEPSQERARFVAAFDSSLVDAQVAAASALLEHVPAVVAQVVERAQNTSIRARSEFVRVLRERGYDQEADGIESRLLERISPSMQEVAELDFSRGFRLLDVLASRSSGPLSYSQSTRLRELATLIAALDLNDMASLEFLRQPDEVLDRVVELAALLYGLDVLVLAAQARIVQERMGFADHRAYFALFDGAPELGDPQWTAVPDQTAAVAVLIGLFEFGQGQALFAVHSLWGAPVSEVAAPLLQDLLRRQDFPAVNMRLVAGTLASLLDGPDPRNWVHSDDPVLRAVAAELMDCGAADDLHSLLQDADGHVREAALNRVASLEPAPPDLREILTEAASRTPTGWKCLACGYVNDAVPSRSCQHCRRSGPQPARLARELLEREGLTETGEPEMRRAADRVSPPHER